MRISRTVAYAIEAMLRLADAGDGAPVPCSHLAAAGGMPERFLLQILRSLVTEGLLRSTRGAEGGYSLARPPKEITLADILRAFENPITPRVPETDGLPPPVRAMVHEALERAAQAARNELKRLTLASLMKTSRTRGVHGPHQRQGGRRSQSESTRPR